MANGSVSKDRYKGSLFYFEFFVVLGCDLDVRVKESPRSKA